MTSRSMIVVSSIATILLLCTGCPSNTQHSAQPKQECASNQQTTQPKQHDRGPVVLTEEGLRIHNSGLLFDGHNDLPWEIRQKGGSSFDKMDISINHPELHTDIPRLLKGGLDAQFWVVYVPPETEKNHTATKMALEQFNLIHRMIKRYPETFQFAQTADDVERIYAEGKIACLIGIEGGHTIENNLATLQKFRNLGARYMGLTHGANNDWADSATDTPLHNGLTEFGERVVLEMNRLGIIVDLAHVSADTMRDALRVTKAPLIASHSSAYTISPHVRNVPDDVLKMIKDNNGVVMINFFPGYSHPEGAKQMSGYFETQRELKARHPKKDEFKKAWRAYRDKHPIPQGTVADLVDHIDHIVKVAGIDHVGLGSDYDGVGIMPKQLDDVSRYPYITQELVNRGYSADDIHKIMGANILRVLRETEQIAKQLSN